MSENSVHREPNSLIHEVSPYLLQHAYNPVQWLPWNTETFSYATESQKPVFLSIGYSTCHWCHVMERESFEDEEVAEILNQHFIPIKVDREERPDIDAVYMEVCQALTGHGGWPLTIVMTPDKKPFFAGTYFPKNTYGNRIGLIQLLENIVQIWNTRRGELVDSAESIFSTLIEYQQKKSPITSLDNSVFDKTIETIINNYDEQYGGMRRVPKFPTAHLYILLLRLWHKTKNDKCLEIVENTLTKMYLGGIWDQVGYGFHRYSTDREWLLPHFEKMLYDQAMMLRLSAEVYHCTKKELYKTICYNIIEYVKENLLSPEGYLYSAEDADSEGVEGKFYLWSTDEVHRLLEPDDAEFFISAFNLKDEGNFYDEATHEKNGTNIPHCIHEFDNNEDRDRFNKVRLNLNRERKKRIKPLLDDKVLTDWNALFVSSVAYAGRVFNDENLTDLAINILNAVHLNLTSEGMVFHRFRNSKRDIPAFLDDYACLAFASWELYQTTQKSEYLDKANSFVLNIIENFYDEENGGFFTESKGHVETPFGRQKNEYDGAIPSGISISCYVIARLGVILQEKRYMEAVIKTLSLYSEGVLRNPESYAFLLISLDYVLSSRKEVVITVPKNDYSTYEAMLTVIKAQYQPNAILLSNYYSDLPEHYNMKSESNESTVFVCENYTCNKPLTTMVEIEEYFS